jgi:hypothetical protein
MSMFAMNKPDQVAELKELRKEYNGTGNFEFLGPKVPEATEDNPTRMKIHRKEEPALTVLVEMPAGYPAEAPPIFKVEAVCGSSPSGGEGATLEQGHVDAIEELLAEQASYMPGMSCVSTCLMALNDLDLSSLDLGEPGRCRSIFKVEVVNNSKQFTKSLKDAAVGSPCVYFFRTIECQKNAKFSFAVDPWRAVYCLCDAPDKKTAVAFMKTIRTDGAMDMDMLGKPGKIQLTVLEEFEMTPRAAAVCEQDAFVGTEYRTTEDLDGLMNPFMAAASGV